jgi:hypothetical protein
VAAHHVGRAYATRGRRFQEAGWDVIPYPKDYRAPPAYRFDAPSIVAKFQLLDIALRRDRE